MTYALCCSPVGTPRDVTGCQCSVVNIGTGVDHFKTGTIDPFEFRRTHGSGDVVCRADGGDPDSNEVHHTVALATRAGAGATLIATPAKTSVAGDVLAFLKRIIAGTNITIGTVTDDSLTINSTGGGTTDSAANVGTGIDPFVNGSSNPFNFRRMEVIDDGSDIHGSGNLAFFQDGNTNRVDLPRGHVQNSNSVFAFNSPVTLIDHTFGDDSAGANVAGKDGEDWIFWWSLKICGDPGFGGIEYECELQVHDGFGFVVEDTFVVRWVNTFQPSSPGCRPFLVSNTNWSVNSGLRFRIRVQSSNFGVSGLFEHPSIHIQRFNK